MCIVQDDVLVHRVLRSYNSVRVVDNVCHAVQRRWATGRNPMVAAALDGDGVPRAAGRGVTTSRVVLCSALTWSLRPQNGQLVYIGGPSA
jgi:hypothetical protein